MKTVTEFPRKVTETPDMGIVLSDGTRLSARVWMPEDATDAPVPAVLEFLPYRKRDSTVARDALTHPYFAGHGYACLRVDMRGNGDSEGLMADEYTAQELADACEVIAWIAAQDWCAGTVGMMGISWGGFNSLQVAALKPPALKAIVTLCSSVDRYNEDIHYKGGCLLNENLGWGATMWAYSSRPPDPALRDDWRALWLKRLENEPFLPATWLRHQGRDGYWKHGSVCEDYSAIEAAVLAVGGWGDSYKNAPPALIEHLQAPAKAILGPWVHKYPHFAVPEPRIGFLQEALRWWDRWLKGLGTGVEDDPAYRGYLMDGVRPAAWYDERPGRWIAEQVWPAPGIRTRRLALTGTGKLAAKGGRFEIPVASPQHCGAAGGEYCAIWLGPEMPGDQRVDDAYSTCFDMAPQRHDADIVGAPEVTLRLSSDKALGQIAVRLNHVHPDGASTRITYGVLNLARAGDQEHAQPLTPGREVEVTLRLDHIAYRLPAGHRLRLAISSAYWPLIWPAPEAATLTLREGALQLPLRRAAAGAEWTFPPPEAAPAQQTRQIRPERHVRRSETDQRTGLVSLVIEDDFGLSENLDHGMIHGGVAREHWEIHPDDPLSARGRTHWTEELARGDWSVRTETHAEMWSDAENFHLAARLEAWEGETLLLTREISETIPRDGL
ncbi:CocE/NonD family hydrolase [Acidimangrovimonas pyrenivorans]|uniref:CocE/NonD family hydrolase n=1 Tax=Acidimangrovimonas pyrenivorans TaxID=2030798 RepID=A0ABV7AL34_9RHOB